jgi:hypothetical protein
MWTEGIRFHVRYTRIIGAFAGLITLKDYVMSHFGS